MIDERTRVMVATITKLHHRGAVKNIQKILRKTHEADVAALLGGLSVDIRVEIFMLETSLQRRAEILSYLKEAEQTELISILPKKEVLTIVSLMDKDDAADLLGHLPEQDSREILSQMHEEHSEEVADLLAFPEDSAGGLMSSEFIALNQNLTIGEAIESFQKIGDEDRVTFYLYAVNDNGQLVGVMSLKQLLISKKTETLKSVMFTDVISANVTTHQEEVAKIVERYDFLSLPVVDGNNMLVGVITVDDVIDVIREEAAEDLLAMGRAGWGVDVSTFEHFKARFPWVLLAFFGGVLCFSIVYLFRDSGLDPMLSVDLWLIAAFLPLILSLGATTGSQAATVAVGAIRAGQFDQKKLRGHLKKEFQLSLLFALIFGISVLLIGSFWTNAQGLQVAMSLALSLQIILAMAIGSTTPILMHRFGWDPTIGSVPFFTTLADLSAVSILILMIRLI